MRTALALSLSLLFAVPAFQQTGDKPQLPTHPPPSKRAQANFSKQLESMQGCWQLVEVTLPGADRAGRLEVAFLLVSQEFMSIEFHMGFFNAADFMEQSYFQSGTYRLSTDDNGFLIATTLIGSYFDERERLVFEPPGTKRSYSVQVDHDQMSLVRLSDAARYSFEKLRVSSDFDFYGRRKPEEKSEEDK